MKIEIRKEIVIVGLIAITAFILLWYVTRQSDKDALIGRWYKMDVEKNQYKTNEYFEFYDDDMFQTSDGETGNYTIQDDKLILQNDNIGRVEIPYVLTYKGRQAEKLELKGNNRTLTFLNAATVN